MLSNTSKMPGKSISLSAEKCITGSKLAKIKDTVCEDCYALKGAYRYPVVKKKMGERMGFFNASNFIPAMVMELNRTKSDYFRWFDSGDIQSMRMLPNIVKIAVAVPTTTFWLPTKENKMVASYLKKHGAFPNNLIVRVSAPMIDGQPPKRFELTSTVHKNEAPIDHECNAHNQDNKCMDCRACWNPSIKNISYKYH